LPAKKTLFTTQDIRPQRRSIDVGQGRTRKPRQLRCAASFDPAQQQPRHVATPGINIVGKTMVLQFVVSFGFILAVNAPQNMVAYGTETFAAKDFVRTGFVMTVIAPALVMLLGATYWRWFGYV
jgi:hypothetical protein